MSEPFQSKRPVDSAFRQQRLKAWQPILTPNNVLPAFFIIGIIFIPLGVGFYITSQNVQEISFDYTSCNSNTSVASMYAVDNTCSVTFNIPSTFTGPVFLYYRLTNFYQNHRRYVQSVSPDQLRGIAVAAGTLSTLCSPLDTRNGKIIYPCGLIANSLFNDTIQAPVAASGQTVSATWSAKDIAWPTDKTVRFQPSAYNPTDVVPPPNWPITEYNATTLADVASNEHLMVWMRTAGLPNFRKLYMRLNGDLPAGTYTMTIDNIYPVTSFGGTKGIVISTTSWLGGKNPFLGIAYIVVGCLCMVLGFVFLMKHLIAPRKLGDHNYLSWNRNPAQ